ncbi:hypothetical protein DF186_22120, partial [Enterococcus hirae]
ERVRVGEHERGRAPVEQRRHRVGVQHAVVPARDLDHLHAVQGGARGVGAVRRVRDQHAHALGLAPRAVVRADHHHADQLAL